MDASKVTELRQRQANTYINRNQVKDASTLTWERQMQASRILPTLNPVANLGGCQTCGSSSTTATITGSTYQKPNPLFNAKGSGSFVYTSEVVAYANAGDAVCCAAAVPPAQQQQYTILPKCDCRDYDIFRMPDGTLTVPPDVDVSKATWLNSYLPIPQPYIVSTWSNPVDSGALPALLPPNSCPNCSLHKLQYNRPGDTPGPWVSTPYVPPNPPTPAARSDNSSTSVNYETVRPWPFDSASLITQNTKPRPIDPTGLNY
jgi:hypothetical protein